MSTCNAFRDEGHYYKYIVSISMIDLPGEVSLITTFTPVLQFPASAGIGLFNASFSNDYPQGTFAFIFYAWLSSPYEMTAPVSIVDPVVCSGPECFTYL